MPLLGDVPVVGRLFRSDSVSGDKRTLFVFMRPMIMRNQRDVEAAAAEPYDRLRAREVQPERYESLLFDTPAPRLPLEIDGVY